MSKEKMLKDIQKRLPDDVIIIDGTNFDFTEDEFVSILCWLKYFVKKYKNYNKAERPDVKFPIISKRLMLDLDLGLYDESIVECKGKYGIYINATQKRKKIAAKSIINMFQL